MKKKHEQNPYQNRSRRHFIKTVSGGAASAFLLSACRPGSETRQENDQPSNDTQIFPPRIPKANPYVTADGRPVLVSITGTDFTRMLQAGLAELGGLKKLVGSSQDVLVKPNLNHSDPFPGISSPTSIADIVREAAAVTTGTVTVGDEGYYSPIGIYDYLDLDTHVSNAGGSLVTFSTDYIEVRRNTWDSAKPNFHVFSEVYHSPVIINTCVLKRHSIATMTCAIKCNVGSVAGEGATLTRQYLHRQSPNLREDLAEIAGVINPELNIVDARSIVARSGPTIEQGEVVEGVNRVIICGDMVATDVYCARILEEHDPTFYSSSISVMLNHAELLGLGTTDLNQVEMIEIST